MDEIENKKMNFSRRFYKAIIDFDAYSKFSEEKLSVAIKYLAVLIALISVILAISCIIKVKIEILAGVQYINDNIENIEIKDKVLSYNNNEPAIYENDNNLLPIIIIDTSDTPNLEEYREKIGLYNIGVIILKNEIEICPSTTDESQLITYNFSELLLDDMNKEEILNLFNNNMIYLTLSIVIFSIEFVEQFIYALFVSIILAIVGSIIAFILRIKINFKTGYKIGIYALTLPLILELVYYIVNMYTGFVIKYFDWMYTTISYIYVCVAILMIKADFINFQKKMIRIKSEKEIIEEEKEKKEMEENQNNQQDENEKKENDENNEDSDEENNLDKQTDG
jgi:hypothetical protein